MRIIELQKTFRSNILICLVGSVSGIGFNLVVKYLLDREGWRLILEPSYIAGTILGSYALDCLYGYSGMSIKDKSLFMRSLYLIMLLCLGSGIGAFSFSFCTFLQMIKFELTGQRALIVMLAICVSLIPVFVRFLAKTHNQ